MLEVLSTSPLWAVVKVLLLHEDTLVHWWFFWVGLVAVELDHSLAACWVLSGFSAFSLNRVQDSSHKQQQLLDNRAGTLSPGCC